MADIECFFDCSSPWTYFAFHNLLLMEKELGIEVAWRPILVGGVFNAVNPSVHNAREAPVPAKVAYNRKDQTDWARHLGIRMHYRPTVFPVNSVKAMRGCILLQPEGMLVPFALATFEAYWGDDKDISQVPVLREICAKAGVDAVRVLAGIERQEIKDRLRATTQELIDRGGFGSPTMFIGGDDMYFGNDRMPLIRDALLRRRHARTRNNSPNIRRSFVMTNPSAGSPDVHGYHAHVYYDAATLPIAEQLSAALVAKFPVELGRFSGEAVGPHPVPQFQIMFRKDAFQSVVPWLMLNRDGLDILVHPLTDDMVDDHTGYALWLGTPIDLRIDTLQRRGYRAELLPTA